jgi:protein-S-isoprenylcysteine O-methyltransferase Ste14
MTSKWRGARGEGYVVAQVIVLLLVFFGPRSISGWPPWPPPLARFAPVAGAVAMGLGALLLVSAALRMRRNLTPLVVPKAGGVLLQSGPFRIVRHPMYAGALLLGFGWALLVGGWLTLCLAVLLFLVFDRKSRREEELLRAKFPAYASYEKRVRKLVPFVY